ncbi:hypothetical protein P4C99_19130 [Pontiellaceae bacterium B1224]|nr:hypothetical protein [Pontiellaceae bacterium B1224]
MNMRILVVCLLVGMVSAIQAGVVLEDSFNDGVLATSQELNGGFYEVSDSAPKDLFSDEVDGVARLRNGSQPNLTGLLSSNTVTLLPGSVTTWSVRDYAISSASSYFAMTWQVTDAVATELSLVADLTGGGFLFYQGGTNLLAQENVTLAFSDSDGFSLSASFDEEGYTIEGISMNVANVGNTNVTYSATWAEVGLAYDDLFFDDYHVGAHVSGSNDAGDSFNIESVTVDSVVIPEPAVLSLIGIFGGGFVFCRRLFGRKNKQQ